MDKQDSIKCLKSMQQWIPDWDDREDGLSYWDAIDMAIAALSQPNEPMTLEQLREMDGEPVYDAKYKKWHVIETVGNCFVEMTDGAIFDSDIWCNNLTDRLYRRPPEGEA